MYLWFLTDPGRLERERVAIVALEASARWLVGATWSVSIDGGLCVDAIIRAHDHDYNVRLIYPSFFPSVPAIVRPLHANERWSGHQYGGVHGPLCLEWGPDNWHPEVTGAQMLESTYQLLDTENSLSAERQKLAMAVPSRHQLTIGQEVRGSRFRLYIGRELGAYFALLPDHISGIFKFSTQLRKESWLALIHEVQPVGGAAVWNDIAIPGCLRGLEGALLRTGVFFNTELDGATVSGANGLDGLKEILREGGCTLDILDQDSGNESNGTRFDHGPPDVLILDKANDPHFFLVFKDGGILELTLVRSEVSANVSRTPEDYRGLAGVSVGIVGVGSLGSKIAMTLGRMGAGEFFLVDHDIFFPQNIERHILDWTDVGDHKVNGTREVLSRISARLNVEVCSLYLTGQESSAAVSGALNRLGRCDLLIDATADSGVFNLLAAVASASQKPLVWAEVYAGGLGGMIARSRPGHDPDAQTMRGIYNQYCLEHPAPALQIARDYAVEDRDGQVLVASDADVSVIAHHAARLAVDTVLERDPSVFPYSMYLIGLAKRWVFEAPFHTIPIDTEGVRSLEARSEVSLEEHTRSLQFIGELLEKRSNAAPPSA